ncbi:hypothetical protein CDAR_420821 [Caerostris darwini]|uniref:Uncharacterized protein n=1 Tax=Caerostris darwini TaxID=1538125 RepID=A0AAV4X2C2_9ARAC|nr:hypothetical protein CDAR_420821 [Caerostris darwini]
MLSQTSWSINKPTFCWATNYISLPAGQFMETVQSATSFSLLATKQCSPCNAHSNITVPLDSQIVEPVLWKLLNIELEWEVVVDTIFKKKSHLTLEMNMSRTSKDNTKHATSGRKQTKNRRFGDREELSEKE